MPYADEPDGDRRQPSECGNGAETEAMKKIKTNRGCWTIDEKMAQTYIHYELANTLAQRDYKMPQAVVVVEDEVLCGSEILQVERGRGERIPSES